MDLPSDRSEQTRVEFLNNELDLCHTFLDLSEVDADDEPVAACARAKAREGFEVVVAWIESVRDPRVADALRDKLLRLKQRIDHSEN